METYHEITKNRIKGVVVTIRKIFHCLTHQKINANTTSAKLLAVNLKLVITVRRLGEDISVDMIVPVCGADHDGKFAIRHPIRKIIYEFPANNEMKRPTMIINVDIKYVKRRPYLQKKNSVFLYFNITF